VIIVQPRSLILGSQKAKLSVTLDLGEDQLLAPKTQLRLVIYDFDRYIEDQSEKSDASGDGINFEVGPDFFSGGEGQAGGPRQRMILPQPFLSPTPSPGNGVLAVVDFNLQRLSTKAELATAKASGTGIWFVNDLIGTLQSSRNSPFSIGLEMFARRDESGNFGSGTLRRQVIGRFGIDKQDLPTLSSPRLLAVRIVVPADQRSLKAGTIILSSLNALDNVVGKLKGVRSRGVILHVVAAQETLSRPGGTAPSDTGTAPFSNRRAALDLTGRYELQAEGVDTSSFDYIAPASLWISQAGQSLVAWYLPYSAVGFGQKFTGIGDDKVPLTQRACLVTAESSTFPMKNFTFWTLDVGQDRVDPDTLFVSQESADPSDDVPVLLGDLEVISSSDPTIIEVLFSRRSFLNDAPGRHLRAPNENATLGVFKRVANGSRLPWSVIQKFKASKQASPEQLDAFVRTNVEPLPGGGWRAFGGRLDEGGRLGRAIRRFSRFRSSAVVVAQEFDNVGKLLNALLNSLPAEYRAEGLSTVQNVSRSTRFPDFAGDEKTLAEWLLDIGETHRSNVLEKAKTDAGRDLNPIEQAAINDAVGDTNGGVLRDLGALGGGEFTYKFEFKAAEIGLTVVLGAAVGGFSCVVTRTSADPSKPEQNYTLGFLGAFIGISAAFGMKIALGKPASGGSAGGAPPSCQVQSFIDIQPREWTRAPPVLFSVAAVSAGVAGVVGPFEATAISPSSALFSVRIPRKSKPAVVLSAIVEDFVTFDGKVSDLKEFLEGVEEGKIVNAQAAIAAASESGGIMIRGDTVEPIPPPGSDMPIIRDQMVPTNPTLNEPFIAFEKNDSRIQTTKLAGLDRRIALYRCLFEVGGWYQCSGFSSPEFKAQKSDPDGPNKLLSQNRAKAADDYLTAIIGQPSEGVVNAEKDHRAPVGAGRGPSLQPVAKGGGGLHDPHAPGVSKADVQLEDATEYHKWRRVDIVVNAILTARLFGR
jgi:hypothetical protein